MLERGTVKRGELLRNIPSSQSVVVIVIILSVFLLISPELLSVSLASGNQASLTPVRKVRSGLVASDSLTTGNLSYWNMYGNALEENATHTYSENSSGLHIGIQAIKNGTWVGFFAESPKTNAFLFHTRLTLPYSTISNDSFNTGMYVQTAAIRNVSYVACSASVERSGYYWQVVATKGSTYGATTFHVLYSKWTGPLTQDCTIITNGNNSLEVYLGGALVYSNQSMNLGIPPPFNAYLEVETTNTQMHSANYSDYYATALGSIKVTNAVPGGVVKLANFSGDTIAESQTAPDGNATISLGAYELPLNASIHVYDSNGLLTASTPKPVSLWGGDVYSALGSTTTSANSSSTSSTISTTTSSSSVTTSSHRSSSTSTSSSTATTSSTHSISTASTTTATSTHQSSTTTYSSSTTTTFSQKSSTTTSSSPKIIGPEQHSTSTSSSSTSRSTRTSPTSAESKSSAVVQTSSSSSSPASGGSFFFDSAAALAVAAVIVAGILGFAIRKR